MPKSNYLTAILINEVLRNTGYTPVATLYLALYTSDPTVADIGTEVSGGSYARQVIAFSAPVGGVTANSNIALFPTPSGAWGTVTHFAIRDALTLGNLLYFGALDNSIVMGIGSAAPIFINGDIVVTEM